MLRAGQMRLLASMIGLFAMIALGSDASLDVSGDHSAGRRSSTIAPDVAPAPQFQPKSPPSLRPAMLGKANQYEILTVYKPPASLLTTESTPGIYRKISHTRNDDATTDAGITASSESTEDAEDILEAFINSRPDLNNNLDVITQAFRFVKLDAHLSVLLNQLSKLQQSHDELQGMTVKQETKFDILAQEMKSLANSLSSESAKLKDAEDRIENEITTMNLRLESAVEKIIKSSTISQFLTDMSKESLQQLDKVETLTEKVLGEIKSVQSELGDVGQASIQAVYNVQKTEENLMTAMAAMENRTVYALRQEPTPDSPIAEKNVSTGSAFMLADSTRDPTMVPALLSCYPGGHSRLKGRPTDCSELQILSGIKSASGAYKIYPFSEPDRGIEVFCDMETDGGGWTVIQRRSDREETPRKNFFRPWSEYEKGFGSAADHVWLGLSALTELTGAGDQELKIQLMDWEGNTRHANYGYFRISNSTDRYRLHIADYSGTAGDSMSYHNGMQFSTKDQDNDLERTVNCAQKYHGAWWYKNCHQANLNGQYMDKGGKHVSYAMGINWYSWHGYYYSLKRSEMKIRNRHFLSMIGKQKMEAN